MRRLIVHFQRNKMNKPKVLVADPVSERGIAELQEGGLLDVTVKTGLKEDELLKIIGEFEASLRREPLIPANAALDHVPQPEVNRPTDVPALR